MTCEVRRRLLRACRQPASAACQYCGRDFCSEHGARSADGQEVCSRDVCREKMADLVHHFAYKEEVATRNGTGRCGQHGCRHAPSGQCSKCDGLFCLSDLEHGELDRWQDGRTVRAPASLCRHCAVRRRLWSRL